MGSIPETIDEKYPLMRLLFSNIEKLTVLHSRYAREQLEVFNLLFERAYELGHIQFMAGEWVNVLWVTERGFWRLVNQERRKLWRHYKTQEKYQYTIAESTSIRARPELDPQQTQELREQLRAVEHDMRSLSLGQRQVILLTEVEDDRSYDELAQALDVSKDLLRQWKFRGCKKLQQLKALRENEGVSPTTGVLDRAA